jgi:hypothetical protein
MLSSDGGCRERTNPLVELAGAPLGKSSVQATYQSEVEEGTEDARSRAHAPNQAWCVVTCAIRYLYPLADGDSSGLTLVYTAGCR